MDTFTSQSPYRLTDNELALWLKFIEHHVGFVLPRSQQHWIKGIIERYLFKLKLDNQRFFQQVSQDKGLFHQFFDEVLIPRTQFFRHQATFDIITNYSKAWKHHQHLQAASDTSPAIALTTPSHAEQNFTVWSVGCATGQEPVSVAMRLTEVFLPVTRFHIWASDYHQQALTTAQTGSYDMAQMGFIPKQYHSWLQPQDDKQMRVSSVLRERIDYFSFNLMHRQAAIPVLPRQCQVIMCQNVLIYFRQFEQRDIIQFLSQYLADDGILIMGVGEASHISSTSLVKLASTKVDILVKSSAPAWIYEIITE